MTETERRKRRRTIHSCTECHRRKQKCDRKLPCVNCVSRRVHEKCTYTNGLSTDPPQPILVSIPSEADSSGSASSWQLGSGGFALTSESSNESSRDPDLVQDHGLVGFGFGNSSDDTPTSPDSEYSFGAAPLVTRMEVASLGYSKNSQGNTLAFLQKVESENGTTVVKYDHTVDADAADRDLNAKYRSLLRQLPARPFCETLVKLFFEAVNWHYGVLDKEVFLELYDTWWQEGYRILMDGGPRRLPPDLQMFPALLYQVLAQALQFLPRDHDPDLHHLKLGASQTFSELSAEYSECGMDLVAAIGRENATLVCVQHDFLRASWLKNSGRVAESWHSLGQAIRASHEIGLHRDNEDDTADTVRGTIEGIWNTQLRQRVWINLLIWDGHMSLILDRPMTINLRDCRVSPPIDCVIPRNRLDRLPSPQYGVPSALTARLLEYRLAMRIPDVLALHASGKYPPRSPNASSQQQQFPSPTQGQGQGPGSCSAAAIMEELHQFGAHFQKTLPATHRFENPDTTWDAECPFLPAQRELLVCHTNAFILGLHRPYILMPDTPDQSRAVAACLAILDSQKRLFDAFDVQYYKLYSLSFFTFDAAVMLSVVLISRPRHHADTYPRALQALADAVSRLRIIAERISLAKTAGAVVQALLSRLKLVQRLMLTTTTTAAGPAGVGAGAAAKRDRDASCLNGQEEMMEEEGEERREEEEEGSEHLTDPANGSLLPMDDYVDVWSVPVPIPTRDLATADLTASLPLSLPLDPALSTGGDGGGGGGGGGTGSLFEEAAATGGLPFDHDKGLFHFEGDFTGNSFWSVMNTGFLP